jgi:hypothetical protein
MRKSFRTSLAAALLLAAAPLSAGLVLTQKVTGEGEGAMNQTTRMSVDTGGAKIELLNSNNPLMPAGSYLLLRPDDDAMLLVNPAKKTYSEFDLAGVSQAMSGLMGGGNPGGGDAPRPEYSEPVVEKLLEEAGEAILGRPTKHFRYRLKWSMTMTMAPGMAMIIENDSIEDSWVATDVKIDPKIARNFENMGAGMTLPKDLEKIVAAQKEVMQGGLPLRRVVKGTTKTTGTGLMAAMASRMAGNQGPTTTTFEVVELSEEKVPASVFAIPAGYTETEMMSPGMKMPDMNRQR